MSERVELRVITEGVSLGDLREPTVGELVQALINRGVNPRVPLGHIADVEKRRAARAE